MTRRRSWLIVAALAGAVVGGCSSAPADQGDSAPRADGIVLLGDSISEESAAQLTEAMPGLVVDAVTGRTLVTPGLTDAGIARVATLAQSAPKWWVVELGTNDAAYLKYPEQQLAGDVTALLGAIGADACVLWVLPGVGLPAEQSVVDGVAHFGDIVRFALGQRTCAATIDWNSVVQTEVNVLGPDGVHLTTAGRVRLADFIRAGLIGVGALPTS